MPEVAPPYRKRFESLLIYAAGTGSATWSRMERCASDRCDPWLGYVASFGMPVLRSRLRTWTARLAKELADLDGSRRELPSILGQTFVCG